MWKIVKVSEASVKSLHCIMVRLKTQINSYLYLYSTRAIGLIPKISKLMTLDKNF